MEDNGKAITLTQKDYQKKYDKKTKMISIKYVLSDMNDYMRLKEYLDRTGQTANSFIKGLINDFFEHKKYEINEERIADYYKDYNVSGELLDNLEKTVGRERFNIIMDIYKKSIESELYDAYMGKGDSFDEWIEQFLSDIECDEIDIKVSEKKFREIIDYSIYQSVADVNCYG